MSDSITAGADKKQTKKIEKLGLMRSPEFYSKQQRYEEYFKSLRIVFFILNLLTTVLPLFSFNCYKDILRHMLSRE